jgi:hypothetical protein
MKFSHCLHNYSIKKMCKKTKLSNGKFFALRLYDVFQLKICIYSDQKSFRVYDFSKPVWNDITNYWYQCPMSSYLNLTLRKDKRHFFRSLFVADPNATTIIIKPWRNTNDGFCYLQVCYNYRQFNLLMKNLFDWKSLNRRETDFETCCHWIFKSIWFDQCEAFHDIKQ